MKELSLNILDIAMNSVKANAKNVFIEISEDNQTVEIVIRDDGCGMSNEQVENVTNPFFTTRTTRNVGLGIPLLKLAAEQTGGKFSIESSADPEKHGTQTKATFNKNHIDFTPVGNVVSTVTTLIQGSPDIRWVFSHSKNGEAVELDTDELKSVLGDVPLDNYEVIKWIEEYLCEGYEAIQ